MAESQMINCKIDGKPVSVPPGTLIIEAALQAGIYIPRFCYHKLLKPYVGCRMCLVEIPKGSEKDPRPFPKPQPSCAIPVQEGMEVETQSERVNAIRRGVMEFTLINHPLDCPICDKGGECDLQDTAYLFGREDSRFHDVKKFHRNHDLSSLIVLDYNRCIQCKRCVRWTEEVSDDDRLIFMERGAHTVVATFNDNTFTSRFGGMTIELCPVGALTSKVFRFKARPWETRTRLTSCSECANGCAVNASMRSGKILRIVSGFDAPVNGSYFCDRGRFAHDYLDNESRIVKPMKRDGKSFVGISWDEAAEILARRMNEVVRKEGSKSVAGCIDPSESIESLWTFNRLMSDGFGTPRIEHSPAPWGLDPDDFGLLLGGIPSFENVRTSKNIVLWDADPFDDAPVLGLQLKVNFEEKKNGGISIASLRSFLGRHKFPENIVSPDRRLAILAGVISTIAAKAGEIPVELKATVEAAKNASMSLTAGEKTAADKVAGHILEDDSALVIGSAILKTLRFELSALLALAVLKKNATGKRLGILPMFRSANSLAAMLMGLRTQVESGGPVRFTGDSVLDWPEEMEKGKIRAVLAVGDGLIEALGDRGLDQLAGLEFLAVVTDFMNPLAARADLIIPRLAPWEQDGTVIALDGSIRKIRELVPHPAAGWPLPKFCLKSAAILDVDIPDNHGEIHQELGVFDKVFKPLADAGAKYLKLESEARGRFADSDSTWTDIPVPSNGTFCAILTESIFQHDTRGINSEHVAGMPEDFCVGISKADAKKYGYNAGDLVNIAGPAGSMNARVKFVKAPQGYIVLPMGFTEHPLASLGLWRKSGAKLNMVKIAAEVIAV